jgi:hypothetical protein
LSKNDGKIITNLMSQRFALFVIRLTAVLLAVGFLWTAVTPKMKPALAERLAALNTEEPMPPAEGPEDVTPGPAQDPIRNPGLVPSPLSRYSAVSMTP